MIAGLIKILLDILAWCGAVLLLFLIMVSVIGMTVFLWETCFACVMCVLDWVGSDD